MSAWIEQRLWWIGILGSILFHAVVIIVLGAVFVYSPVQLTVSTGSPSTEIQLTTEPDTPPVDKPVDAPTPIPTPVPTPEPTAPPDVPAPPKPKPKPSVQPVSRRPASNQQAKPNAPAVASHDSRTSTGPQPDADNELPEYLDEWKAAHEQGLVVLRVEVSESGRPLSVSIQQSSGFVHLDQSARKAVSHWRFHPGTVLGVPVETTVDVPIRFRLE